MHGEAQALSLVLGGTEDAKVQNRRQQDVGHLQMRLEALEDELLEADADAAEACDREDTYTMMDGRLRDLVSDDQARINKIQRVIDESKLRLNQWHGVSKDGEAELGRAEAELAALRAKLKTERHTQRKMMGERRKTVETMVQYTKDRVAREAEHRDQLMASRGDLDAEGEAKLKMAAGTMEALRAMDSNSKVQLSFEKCRAARPHSAADRRVGSARGAVHHNIEEGADGPAAEARGEHRAAHRQAHRRARRRRGAGGRDAVWRQH